MQPFNGQTIFVVTNLDECSEFDDLDTVELVAADGAVTVKGLST